ncbi:MAG: AbiV family abortive infection protein [Bacteroidetes bacterium]|nr:AbiV family abortive infection protein [Bacteroidota bacterium]
MQTIKSRLESSGKKWRDIPQLWDLRRSCIKNSIELLNDAKLLYKHRRYPRAFALAFTSYEEFGKGQLVSDYITGVASEEEFWLSFRSHDLKTSYNNRKIVINTDRTSSWTVEYNNNNAKTFFRLRMDSLYVDCSKDYTPSIPQKQISAKTAKQIIVEVEKYINPLLTEKK